MGQLLRKERTRHGYTLRQVSETMTQRGEPFPASTLARVEQGKLDPGVRRLQSLLSLYDVSPALVSQLVEVERLCGKLPEGQSIEQLREEGLRVFQAGDYGQGVAYALAAIMQYDPASDDRDAYHGAMLDFAIHSMSMGYRDLGRFVMEQVARDDPDAERHPNMMILAANLWLCDGASFFSAALAREAVRLATEREDRKLEARARHQLAQSLTHMGDYDGTMAELDRAIELYGDSNDGQNRQKALGARAECLNLLGRSDEALELCTRMMDECRESSSPLLGHFRNLYAELMIGLGRPADAIKELREALGNAVLLGHRSTEFYVHYWLWKAYEADGDTERAEMERKNAIFYVRYARGWAKSVQEVRDLIKHENAGKR
ncbi:hypothetical protein ABI59_04575 [Acidobacteria bacterium Mor1]|nr:hypothetical protein ABI59_04575 [Acidobacteria bacterium Mor1]